jgi:hypothetical protein
MPALDPRPLERRRQDGGADMASLVELGMHQPPPRPSPPKPPPVKETPPAPAPASDPVDEATLNAALAEAGLSVEAEDVAAMKMLAALDSGTVAIVAKWVKGKKKDSSSTK